MRYRVGDEVVFECPDEENSWAYGIVTLVQAPQGRKTGGIYTLTLENGNVIEAFEHELS